MKLFAEKRHAFFTPLRQNRAAQLVFLLAVVFAALFFFDWGLRFGWYRWHRQWVIATRAADNPRLAKAGQFVQPAQTGGDLTSLLAVPSLSRRFAVKREAVIDYLGEHNLHNAPGDKAEEADVVFVGDSYFVAGPGYSNRISSVFNAASGLDVYNYGLAGSGPVYPIAAYLHDKRFRLSPPRYLVWGLVERELGGDLFKNFRWHIRNLSKQPENNSPQIENVPSVRLRMEMLKPGNFTKSLIQSSAMAQLFSKWWNWGRYTVFNRLPEDVAIAIKPIQGRDVLFYRWSVKAMRWGPKERKPEAMVDIIQEIDQLIKQRGSRLVVLLIPDKEQVYREWLPEYLNPQSDPIPPSFFGDLEIMLTQSGVNVINLLPLYTEHAERDELLYWPDDTHWNPKGILAAARAVYDHIREQERREYAAP